MSKSRDQDVISCASPLAPKRFRDIVWKDYPLIIYCLITLFFSYCRFYRHDASTIFESFDELSEKSSHVILSPAQRVYVHKLSWIIPALSARVPWRCDCIIQAMAARHLLIAKNLPSTFCVGVQKKDGINFSAHAWLLCGGHYVTGASREEFTPIFHSSLG